MNEAESDLDPELVNWYNNEYMESANKYQVYVTFVISGMAFMIPEQIIAYQFIVIDLDKGGRNAYIKNAIITFIFTASMIASCVLEYVAFMKLDPYYHTNLTE